MAKHVKTTELAVGEKHHKLAAPKKPEKKGKHHLVHKHTAKKGLFRQYAESWKEIRTLTFLLVIAYDLAFYVLLYPLFYGYGYVVNRLVSPFQGLDIASLTAQSAEQLGIYQQSLSNLVVFVFLISLVFALLLVLVWSLSRAFIWARILRKKITVKYLWKFYLLNLVWVVIWAVVSIILGSIFYKAAGASRAAGIIIGLVFALIHITLVYLMYIMYYKFAESDHRVFRSIKEAFVLGTTKCPGLALPVIMVLATIVMAVLVSYLFKLLPDIIMDVLSYVLFFGVFAWIKIYSAGVLRERV